MDGHYINYNGDLFPRSQPIITAGNRGLRYGDGVFETMKLRGNKIIHQQYHFERLFAGLQILKFRLPPHLTSQYLQDTILQLSTKNESSQFAKARLMLFRKEGTLFDHRNAEPSFIIETFSLSPDDLTFSQGLTIDIMPEVRKSCDILSRLKSNNYLPYTLAAIHAAWMNLDECIILNSNDRVCEGTISNVFIVKNSSVFTPPLSEGCVAGTMRRRLLEDFSLPGFQFMEKPFSIDELLAADEVFFTNAISFIRPVKTFREKNYPYQVSREIFKHLLETIYQ